MGTAPAPGAADRRPRRLALKRGESPNGELECTLAKVLGEGANHCARGGRAPLQLNGSGLEKRRCALRVNDSDFWIGSGSFLWLNPREDPMSTKTKIVLLGAGFIADIHLESYHRFVPDAEVVAV